MNTGVTGEDLLEGGGRVSLRARVRESQAGGLVERIAANRVSLGAFVLFSVIVFAVVLAPWISPYDPYELHPDAMLQRPCLRFPMGTDELGRDLSSRVLHGGRVSLAIGFLATLLAFVVGVPLGVMAGYVGRVVDDAIMRVCDALLAFPPLLLALVIVAVFGPKEGNVVLAIGIMSAPAVARIARAAALAEKAKDYVLAAKCIGASSWRIIWRHIVANSMAPLLVQASITFAVAVLIEAVLSFLGLGVQPPRPSWGNLVKIGYGFIHQVTWYVTFPGLAIFATVTCINLIGDALRDALDPRLRGGR
jgi:ABC-type dipeptide/oligopeptide/nickel transport system permease subunit